MRKVIIYLSIFFMVVLGYIITQQNWHNEYEMDRAYELNAHLGDRVVLTFATSPSSGYGHHLYNYAHYKSIHLLRQSFVSQYALLSLGSDEVHGYDKFVFEARKAGTDTIEIMGCVLCQEELLKPATEQNISRSTFIVHVRK